MGVAQLAEWSLPIPEDPSSNPVIGNFYLFIYLLLTFCRRDENKEKEAGNGPFFLKNVTKSCTAQKLDSCLTNLGKLEIKPFIEH